MKTLTGRRLEIASGLSGLDWDKVLSYRDKWERQGYSLPALTFESPSLMSVSRGKAGTILTRKLAWVKKLDPLGNSKCKCRTLADEMDRNGVDWCERHSDSIVNLMVSHGADLAEYLKIPAMISRSQIASTLMRFGAKRLLRDSIREARESKVLVPSPAKRRSSVRRKKTSSGRRPYTGWRSIADGPQAAFGPFTSNVRHLTYHIWPANTTDFWRWNLRQLKKRWRLFNGVKILGVVTDRSSATLESVIEYAGSIGMEFDHVVHKQNNPKLRETVTWVPMLELLDPGGACDNEVVFSAHAKGAQYHEFHTQNWTDLMYQSCLDYWPLVDKHLSQSLMTGSFREFGLLGKWHDWAYSGTFYWWRLKALGQRQWRDVDQWFAGTESWPGKMCDPRETECIFLNNNSRLYDKGYWRDTVWPEWHRFRKQNEVYYAP